MNDNLETVDIVISLLDIFVSFLVEENPINGIALSLLLDTKTEDRLIWISNTLS
ncbi:hypothetical protein [Bacillus sp. CECT 9360]|uniref:hypothetical protein n=1 Tax=Bacillus sp. CECT 9360 TaxID=2845821 RepID=UPI001E4084F6|nr:hypothetical protein [Bacillus sp. CECT 9360]CAH0346308.1 hypothetical protein BCI9360_02637 [Bacillus sp. CECT 9360]